MTKTILCVTLFPIGVIANMCGAFQGDDGLSDEESAKATAAEARRKIEEQIEAQADLARSLAQLEMHTEEGATAEKAVSCLEMCCKTLAQIKNRFIDMKLFWANVALNAQTLQNQEEVQFAIDLEDDDEFTNAFIESGKGWAALGRVSLQAQDALVTAREAVKNVMEDLPVGEVQESRVKEMCDKLQTQIAENYKDLDDEKQVMEQLALEEGK